MMRRRLLLVAGALSFARPAFAERRNGSFRIGHLALPTPAYDNAALAPFREKLASLGYTEGKNLVLDIRSAKGNYELLPGLAAELVVLRPDVIYVSNTPALMAVF